MSDFSKELFRVVNELLCSSAGVNEDSMSGD